MEMSGGENAEVEDREPLCPSCAHSGGKYLRYGINHFVSYFTIVPPHFILPHFGPSRLPQQEFADPDWDAAVDEAQDEQQWQVRHVQGNDSFQPRKKS